MIFLKSASERAYDHYCRVNAKREQTRNAAMILVLEEVHPGNLGPLPPDPQVLLHKALMIGLLQYSEYCSLRFNE